MGRLRDRACARLCHSRSVSTDAPTHSSQQQYRVHPQQGMHGGCQYPGYKNESEPKPTRSSLLPFAFATLRSLPIVSLAIARVMESGGSAIAPSTAGQNSSQGPSPTSSLEYQSFRSHGAIVKIKVKHNQPLGAKYVYWSDLSSCFPGIARVQLGDVVLTFMRGEDELR